MLYATRVPREQALLLMDQYVAAGGTFIDSANIYAHWERDASGGESEVLIGEWMRMRRNRQEIFLASKVGFEYPGVERGLRASQIAEECEKSLRRLHVETIDLYYAHVDDLQTP